MSCCGATPCIEPASAVRTDLTDEQRRSFRRTCPQRHPLFPAGGLVRDVVPILGAALAEQVCLPPESPLLTLSRQ